MKLIRYKKSKKIDIEKIIKLFSSVFKITISKKYLTEIYFKGDGICYVALSDKKIIGFVGFVKKKSNINKNSLILSRHSSCIHKNYRRKKIYTNLCTFAYEKLKIQYPKSFIISWPNQVNLKVPKNTIFKNEIILSKYYQIDNYKNINYKKLDIKKLEIFKKINILINKEKYGLSIIDKDTKYYKKWYLNKQINYYSIKLFYKDNKFEFIFNKKKYQNYSSLYLFEYIGSKKLYKIALKILYNYMNYNQIPFSFWLNIKKNNLYLFLKNNNANFNNEIFFVKASFFQNKKNTFLNNIKKSIFLMGDTDVYKNIN